MVWASHGETRRVSESAKIGSPSGKTEQSSDSVKIQGLPKSAVYENHPVLHSMETQLQSLRDQYRAQPSEQSRYALVRHEQLLAEWAPLALKSLQTQM
jgi:hypothetical protein